MTKWKLWRIRAVALALALLVTACGGGLPTAPSNTVDVQGVWEGNWQKASCTDTVQGQACGATSLPPSGAIRLTLTQTGTQVQGTVEVGSLLFTPSSGSVNANGALSLTGSVHVQANAPGTFTLSNWSTTRSGNTMTGSFTLTFVADNPAFGSAMLQLTLQNVVKTS